MKNKYFLFVLILIISTFSFIKASGQEKPLLGKTIYLDPGHGGRDPGTNYKDIKESDVNLAICLILREKLELIGATVYLTREGDYDLSTINTNTHKRSDLYNRQKAINDSNADMYISIHLNATTSSKWQGAQVFFDDVNNENEKIAQILTESLETKREYQEIKNMYLNRNIKVPGVLIEAGFLSNYHDRNKLITYDYQEQLADKIVKGIVKYYQ